jgi:tetratricopeptide (TPR) repeat protein
VTRSGAPRHADPSAAVEEAVALHRQGRLDEAEKAYTRLMKAYPGHFDVLHLLGVLKHHRGKSGEALRLITSALKIMPNSPDALSNLGMVLHTLKRRDEAVAALDKALAQNPNHVEALTNKANACLDMGRGEEALACLDVVLRAQPSHAPARLTRANAYALLRRYDEALADYDYCVAAMPSRPPVHYNRGTMLLETGRLQDALASFDRAIALAPNHIGVLNNRGNALQALNRSAEAAASFEKAVALDKTFADAQYNLAAPLLIQGDFARGLDQYEWRWKRSAMAAHRPSFSQPLWTGQFALANRTILLHAEQGLGDTLQFVRYVGAVAAMAGHVVLEVQASLQALLAAAFPDVTVIASGDARPRFDVPSGAQRPRFDVPSGAQRPRFDVQCPLGSLPLAFKTRLETIPAQVPYLQAPDASLAKWRTKLGIEEKSATPIVAFAWAGRATHANDRNRSLSLDAMAPLLSIEGARFLSIQRDLRNGEAAQLAALPGCENIGDALDDFTDTAAVMTLADVVIAVDTAVVHLAGALARPVRIMLPFAPDWRWLHARSDSPWYPSARLFRQSAPGDWTGVIGAVTAALKMQIAT